MENDNTSRRKSYIGLALAAMTIFIKSTKIVAALKVLKFTKPLITVISMAISAVLYGIGLGPWFGVGLVAMLFIHEMGHIIALRMKGYETPGPVFIPFLGAVIFAPKFDNRDTEAFVGFGGPLFGTIGALACLAIWPFTDGKTAEIVLLVSYVGIFLNLFNLIPISPMDGGRVTQAIGGWFKYVGLGVLLVYTITTGQPGILLIWILCLDGFKRFTLWLRPWLAGILGVSMATLMFLGYGDPQPWHITVMDCVIAIILTGMYWIKDSARSENGDAGNIDDRAYPTGGVRAKWLGYYLGLVVLASFVIFWQVGHLPHEVKQHSEQLTSPQVQ
ncbi:MAG: site-2 protease family protein [Candidatus Adlerbacteria bacterium]|nr:site-2 protease family protein [Candidatus Adlerbacteria bacterium]